MDAATKPKPLAARLLLPGFLLLYALLTCYAMAVFASGSQFGGVNKRSVVAMEEGSALRPHVYRVVVPAITRWVVEATPDAMRQSVTGFLAEARQGKLAQAVIQARHAQALPSLADATLYDVAAAHFVVLTFLIAYLVILYKLAAHLMPQSRAYALFAPVVSLLVTPTLTFEYAYIYDYPTLTFMALCLLLMVKERWPLYLLALAFATANKESAVYIIFIYGAHFFSRMPRGRFLLLLAGQLVVFACIKMLITSGYSNNPGSGLMFNLYPMLSFLISGYSYLTFLGLAASFALFTCRWSAKPLFLRSALWSAVPIALGYLCCGLPHEYRGLIDFVPVGALLATHTLVSAAGFQRMSIFRWPEGTYRRTELQYFYGSTP